MYIDYNQKILIIARIFFNKKNLSYLKKMYIVYLINKVVEYTNNKYLNEMKNKRLEKYIKYDNEQLEAIYSNEINTFVIAGAGSGKTSLIIGKINFLIEYMNYKENEILCISYTNDACDNLKKRLLYNVEVLTFHKLAIKVLKNKYKINNNYLKFIIDEYFYSIIKNENKMIKKALNLIGKKDVSKYYYFLERGDFNNIKRIIFKYINLFILNGYDYSSFLKYKINRNFLALIIDIYTLYLNELISSNEVDLNILIKVASKSLENSKLNYKYIIIDEYQDISKIRYDFINNLVKYLDAKLLTVGDDYQSIYKFSGSNLKSFLSYNKYKTKVIKLKNNYRCCKEIVQISNSFILKNRMQIKKRIKAHKSIKKCIILIRYKKNILYKLLVYLCKKDNNILILGRNRNDINNYIAIEKIKNITKRYNKIIRYKTIHSAKGLQEDSTIILNLTSNVNGFPNKIKNNILIDSLMNKEKYLYAEERRLFYVALTRSTGITYVIEHKNESIFLSEIKKIGKRNIDYLSLE